MPSTSTPGFLSLPPELILEIYTWATIDHYSGTDLTKGPPRGAVISQICRPLRELAISSQTLWDCVPRSSSSAMTELCLARAPTAPLCVDLRAFHENEDLLASKRLVLPHLSRAKYFRLYVKSQYESVNHELTLIYNALTSQPMPLLEAFNVSFDNFDFGDRDCLCINLPQPLFNGVPPGRLRDLQLSHVGTTRSSLPPTMPVSTFSTTLCSLDLINSYLWKDVDEMIEFFQNIPLLESLKFAPMVYDNELFDTTPSRTHSPRCVRMDHLQTFITGESSVFSPAMAVFAYLAMPPLTKLIFYSENDDSWAGDHWYMLHAHDASYISLGVYAIREHFAAAIAAGEHYEILQLNGDSCTISPLEYDGEDEDDSLPCRLHLPAARFLRLTLPTVAEALRQDAWNMQLSLPIFTKVTLLSVKGPVGHEVWIAFEQYKDVRYLYLGKDALLSLTEHTSLPPGGHRELLFPRLREIHIRNQDLSLDRFARRGVPMLDVTIERYLAANTRRVVYIERRSCPGAEELAGRLREKLQKDGKRIIVYSSDLEEGAPGEG